YQPIPVTDEATTQQALQIRERTEDFPGITAEPTAVRRYAAPGLANTSQVLGYLSPVTDEEITKAQDTLSPYLRSDQVGRSGLERTYDKELRGKAGVTRYEVDNLGRVIGQAMSDEARPGANVVTSVDARVQAVAEYELHNAMKTARKEIDRNTGVNYKADSGAVVVMEAKTGRVVAMASQPTYDPNAWVGGISAKDYAKLTGKKSNFPLLNRAIQGQAAPGSIFKVISSTAAVNAGYDFNGSYPCPSSYSVGGQVFKNFESQGYGSITIGKALEVSCDTVYYGIAHKEWQKDGGMKPKKNPGDWFYKTAHQFGLGKETGIDLPNEVTGRVPDRQWKKNFWKANKASWCKQGKKGGTYVEQIAYEGCLEGDRMRAGDSVNYSIGQGDTLVTPIQMATIYSAISNGGTLFNPTVGKAIISADGKRVEEIAPKAHGRLPFDRKTRDEIDEALAGVATRGSAAWRFGGWPQDRIPMHAKTGTAEVYGKQTTSWFASYTKDYTIVMTISQG
ncbi:penicillin-binding protein 2, partial [Streptomyces sp. SID3212]|uniref:penicillin-binding protein 2 n=1 Tax=Streptomyces sp. SID3212 TaxID=2690259 RepID=UPI0013702966